MNLPPSTRPLDLTLYNLIFNNTSPTPFLTALQSYQNPDSGFAHGTEPDIQSPLSSPMSTTYAFQYFSKSNIKELPTFLSNSFSYLKDTFTLATLQWLPISKEINDSPHAPWWTFSYKKYLSTAAWGNPTVEILGYLLKYPNDFDPSILLKVKEKAFKRIEERSTIETHELQCYNRLYNHLSTEDQKRLEPHLKKHVLNTVEQDPKKWEGYVTKPLTFIDSPESIYYDSMSELVELQLDSLMKVYEANGIWQPSWSWGTYPEVWKTVKEELSGVVTVSNLILLRNFGRI